MSKFTPGPWAVAYLDRNDQRVVQAEYIEICTCWHHSIGSIGQEMEANARLIAAAPEMYEALKALVNAVPHSLRVTSEFNSAWHVGRAALAKAAP